tara:strand:- start:19 stop:189 length:171 start_codon:yes stop_codon:yes gene_type:complete
MILVFIITSFAEFWFQLTPSGDPELLNLHKRLSIQLLVIANGTPILPVVNTLILLM